ncbi:DUF305 domain-containing protein [Myceligenerans xiligouense]|uniref:Uncharacterized protein (DUF305 family) n=1 Tax=Myceligenerans xiligouense TaxID=253184 RepID=A0A3N4YM96_9MICO|nr:DUF305 domain-containing protein [Myceligenerans xiligouense]RPF21783.1 uncharacterized protein (DUF305 family) [Myceligenerans xiligouense]
MNHTLRRTLSVTAALVAGLSLAACSGTEGTGDAAPGEQAGTEHAEMEQAEHHNEADTEFAQMMIVHHQGAVEMSELALEKSESPAVQGLANRIAAAQQPEIDRMTDWLDEWGEESDPAAMDMESMDHEGMDMSGDGMEGMDHGDVDTEPVSQDEAMATLETLDGADFDRQFLHFMIAHHQGALTMSQNQTSEGVNEDALALAADIAEAQAAEIAEMEELAAQVAG